MNFEHELILHVVGEELYHKLCIELSGLQVNFKKVNKATVLFYLKQGLSSKQIAHKLKISQSAVYNILSLENK